MNPSSDKQGGGQGSSGYALDQYSVQPQQGGGGGEQSPYYKSAAPSIDLPKGGGALKGIDEKFSVNAVNGTAGVQVGLPLTPGRGGFTPALGISYSSGGGNSEFGLGWGLGLPAIQRKTDKQLPRYNDGSESDVFLLAGAEDLVPLLDSESGERVIEEVTLNLVPYGEVSAADITYRIKVYIPRIEGLYARIEHINIKGTTESWWRVTTKDNLVTYYGLTAEGRIADPSPGPEGVARIYKWLPQLTTDFKGNVQWFEYKAEDDTNVTGQLHERNRLNELAPFTNTYLKRVCYCNKNPYDIGDNRIYQPVLPTDLSEVWLMSAVLDYGDHPDTEQGEIPYESDDNWSCRTDPFSDFHAGFEIRTYRKCKRVTMYHHFKELGDGTTFTPKQVRSLDLFYEHDAAIAGTLTEADYITRVRQTGYRKVDTEWRSKWLPEMTMDYRPLDWDTTIHSVTQRDTEHAPQGLTGPYQWMDLYGEGVPGILSEQPAGAGGVGWYYKSNLGDAHFTPAKKIAEKPSFAGLGTVLQWGDLEADGSRQLVSMSDEYPGYFEVDESPFDSAQGAISGNKSIVRLVPVLVLL